MRYRPFQAFSGFSLRQGFSLVEVLLSFAIFSSAIAGLYIAVNGVSKTLVDNSRNDILAAVANGLISQVNIYDQQVETDANYNVTTKTPYQLQDGTTVYWTRQVNTTSGYWDQKNVNVYFYKSNAGGATPYRVFKREVNPARMAYIFGHVGLTGLPSRTVRDSNGQIWTVLEDSNCASCSYSVTVGPPAFVRAGYVTASHLTATYQSAVSSPVINPQTGTADTPNPFQYYHSNPSGSGGTDTLQYKFPVTQNAVYRVTLGFAEPAGGTTAGQRSMDVTINGTVVGNGVDPMVEAAGVQKPVTKIYSNITPSSDSGIYVINLQLAMHSGATLTPVISSIMLERE